MENSERELIEILSQKPPEEIMCEYQRECDDYDRKLRATKTSLFDKEQEIRELRQTVQTAIDRNEALAMNLTQCKIQTEKSTR